MRSLNQFHMLSLFGLLSLLSACNQESALANDGLLSAMDFKQPIELEFTLKTKDLRKSAGLCKVDSPHKFSCHLRSNLNASSSGGEVSAKTKAVFSKKELIDLIHATKQKHQTEGTITYSIAGKLQF